MRGWKWQRRDSEGSEEQERDSESLEGQGRLREAGQDPRRSGAGAVPGVTVPSRGTRHRDSTRTCGETPNPSGDPRRAAPGQGQSNAPAQLPAAPSKEIPVPSPSSVLTWNDNVSQSQHGEVVGVQPLLQQVLRENHCEEQREAQ